MGDFFVYILKSSVCLAVFYLFYRLLLSRETFHRINRIALLSVIVLSVAIPFIRIITDEPVAIQRPLLNLESLFQMAEMQTDIEVQTPQSFWLPLLFVVYLAGCVFFFLRFLYSMIRIWRMIGKGERTVLSQGCKLVVTNEAVSPFSWMGYIVISRKDMDESGEEILTHELAHIGACHSLDMLVCSFCVILQWFNPAVWLLKQELQNIHEYEADESVINHGVDAKRYQLLLIKKAVGSQRFTSMANSFNHSKLKKRITMMLKRKSNPWARLKYLYVLPLTAVAVVAFARPEISRELEKISSAKISEIVPVKEVIEPKKAESVVEAAPVPEEKPVVKPVVKVTSKVDTSVPQDTKIIKIEVSPVEKKETEDPLESMQKQLDDFSKGAEDRMKKIKTKVEMSRNLILIDYEVATYEQLDAVSPDDIFSFSVSPKDRSKELLAKYNATDKQGVISVVTKKGLDSGKVKENEVKVVGHGAMEGNLPGNVNLRIRNSQGSGNPLVFVDGVEQTDEDAIQKINPNIIESISVMKDESAKKMHGEKARNGVIYITTKNALKGK